MNRAIVTLALALALATTATASFLQSVWRMEASLPRASGESWAIAEGGVISTQTVGDASYRVHTFTSGSNTLTVTKAGKLEYLVVGGGAGRGAQIGAGRGGEGVESAGARRGY
jgi:hypothetical protein